MPSTSVLVFVSLGKTIAQITAELSPIPGLPILVEVLCGIIELCENIGHNKHAAKQLRDRCHALVLAFRDFEQRNVSANINQARNDIHDQLIEIHTKMNGWAQLGKFKSFVQQEEIAKDIERSHMKITDCITSFNLTSQFEIHEWMNDFGANQRRDHSELIESLSEIQQSQILVETKTDETNDLVRKMMTMFQQAMGENKEVAERVHKGLSANLYQFQAQFKELPPDSYLKSGEVVKIGNVPTRGTHAMDIYEGLYLGQEKVAIKVIRSMNFNDQSKRRFAREANIWHEVWNRDHGAHIVPFYGYCQLDAPFPCMVSPWQTQGDALTYVKSKDKFLDYHVFIIYLAEGVQVLHNMSLIHGDIRAANVLVNDFGLPLLSDFGLSKIITDISGGPLTQSSIMSDSYRYFAPEVFEEEGNLSLSSDIYSLAMTLLELLTHTHPYQEVKHHIKAGNLAAQGKHPVRPSDSDVLRRGLTTDMWSLLVKSWSLEPQTRPSIDIFISSLMNTGA
ncbi:kinase-like domain-containing protein [Crepidotus variabilis]|uniref:Kinase-like domain-containing protein n=1 Tax=Crepidotus variabilis TaxID=179855 RepID=A0A9P6ET28_9AGAR|nr:kinase-like domain-containing protein [Crepidotus variabilis]